jgi:uncharacterized damage-inducible protein DinB
MAIRQGIIMELQHEAANTRKMLERVPLEKGDWKPHDKSMSLTRLATHVAELPSWTSMTLHTDELDWAKFEYKPTVVHNTEELLALHDKNVADAISSLENASDEDIMKPWTMRRGEQVFFTLPKAAVIRNFSINHGYHHRGQLSVFLRLNDVPVPGMFGPSADETM